MSRWLPSRWSSTTWFAGTAMFVWIVAFMAGKYLGNEGWWSFPCLLAIGAVTGGIAAVLDNKRMSA